ncbi:glutamate-rich protein 3 [Scomber japonicus]|uniref:glutamate-rich protein 3 n=1 Tax=Scomber japonicus TaxID=13676 RepID=UPI002305F5F5|nr:glutamate-rich protein 3 [Scomber japonicus]
MSHLNPGLISAYNSLTDKHLAGYFSNTRIRRHLQRAGLITRSGRIVPDKEYRHKLIQRTHQRHVRECLAQAIFHKVLEMERLHQIEIKRKLEEFARRERVHKIKVERSKRYEEEIIHILSPRPPTGARGVQKQHSGPEGEHSESSESPSSSRPNTAPGKMQRPVRLKPIHSNSNTASLRRSSPYRLHGSSNENDQPFNCTMDKESRRRLTMTDTYRGISPYCLPVINNFVTPVPPTTKRKERGVKVTPSSTVRGRRLRPTTASSGVEVHEEPPMLRSSVHQSRVCVNMVYFGKTVHLSHDLSDMRDEIKVFQQHCGGENLCVYKGKLREGEMFGFISRRHRGFPFSLTFFLNGLQVERLSSCCEFKHRKGSRLGGRHGHFGFSGVEGASPCYKCIIAMGLDKKPTPPPKKVKDDGIKEETVASPKGTVEMETERTVEDASSHSECETSQPQDMETQVKEETAPEDKLRDDYEEDFEADDEGPTEDTEVKEKKSPPPPRETEKQAQQRDTSETEDDDKDEDIKSHSGSSSSGSDREESDTEAPKDSRENEIVEQTTEVDQEETAAPSDEKDELNPEEAVTESAAAKDSDIQDSAGDSTEIEISDASVPSGTENKQGDETSGDKEDEKTSDKSKQGEEQERAKSVQEKLAEAILKESQCSSEPELSDTSTEEEEEATDKGHKQDNEDAVPDKNVVVEAEVVLVQEETSEPKEQKDEEAHEGTESSQDEMVKKDEDVEKVASEGDKDEATVEKDESGVMEIADAALQLVSEEKMAEGDKTSESQDDAAANTDANTDAADKDEENMQKTAEEAETRPDETGNGAKSSGEHESSVSDLNKKTDETEVPDNAEAEAMTANETMEMKAEPSEDREALSCEEAPVTNTEGHQEDSEDRTAGSETEVTADNSSSSSEGSGDTTVHAEKAAETNEDNAKDESSKDDVKEEEAEEASGAEADKDDSKKQVCDAGEETEKSVEINDKVEEEKSEEESKEEKETNPDEIPDGERTEERKKDETDNTEGEQNDESKAEESIKNDENITEETKTDSNTEGKSNEEQTEKTLSEEDKVANEEKADESEKTENDEDKRNLVDSQCVKSEDCGGESEGKAAAADQTNEGEEINETNADADEEKGDRAEMEKDENDNKAKESEVVNKDEEEKEIITDMTVVAEEIISGITEEPEKSLHEGEAANANGTKTSEETLNNVTEAENVEKEAVKESENGERREVDAENGEKSTGAESKTNEDGTETLTEEKNNVNTPVQDEEDRKTDELMENENKDEEKVTVESGDGAGQREDNMVDQAPAAGMVESEAEEGEASAENLNESNKKDSEPEISGTEIKEETKSDHLNTDRKNSEAEEMKEDPNDKDSDTKKDNNQDQVSEAVVASSGDQAQSSTDHKENEESDLNSDKHTDENVAAALSVADGENGRADTEEVSKASEEGASVLLKPQEQSTEVAHNDAEESPAIGTETPETLAKEDNTDLVTNWVTMHQTSKYFETFVEPLEDLRDSEAQTTNSNTEETQSTELTRSVSPLKTVRTSDGEAADGVENAEEGHTQKDVTEAGRKNEVEAVQLDLQNNESENNEPLDKEPGKDTLQVEETEVKNFTPNTETQPNGHEVTREDMRSEEHKGSRGSLVEDKIQEGPAEGNIEETDISKTEVESIACTNHSGISGNPESVTETQTEEKMTENQPDLHEKQTEEKKDHLSLPKTEEHPQCSESSELVSTDTKADAQKSSEETQEKTDEDSREVTEITDFTTAKSDDGSQGEIHPKPSEGSINGDRRDTQLIQDIKHTLSKDRMSMFSVDETLFGRSSYPLLTTARTESGL